MAANDDEKVETFSEFFTSVFTPDVNSMPILREGFYSREAFLVAIRTTLLAVQE